MLVLCVCVFLAGYFISLFKQQRNIYIGLYVAPKNMQVPRVTFQPNSW